MLPFCMFFMLFNFFLDIVGDLAVTAVSKFYEVDVFPAAWWCGL